jgi:16S rRNA (cytosine967-C5)-methyltransferase
MANFFHRRRKTIGSRDRRFLSETVYAAFRHRTFLLEWLKKLRVEPEPPVMVLFAAAVEGLLSDDDFRSVAGSMKQAGIFGENVFPDLRARKLPAGLTFDSQEKEWAVRYSFPEWMITRWRERFGEEGCLRLLEVSQKRPPLVVRANWLKISRDGLVGLFRKRGYGVREAEKSRSGIYFSRRENLFNDEEFRGGFFEVQDEGSQLLCEIMDPKPGELIWDVCAGGGGKSLALAAAMKNKGRIIATDIRSWKLGDLKRRAKRAGAYNIFPADLNRLDEIHELKNGADKILVDAPCSGTGTLRRNPDARWRISEGKLKTYQQDQFQIVQKALPYLKKCGKLYYATCSLECEENEEVARLVLEKNPDLRLVEAAGGPDEGFVRFLPQRDGTDGFFMAVFEKVS